MIKVGDKYKSHREIYHVRAIVDDYWCVVRYYSQSKGWRYSVEHFEYIEIMMSRSK